MAGQLDSDSLLLLHDALARMEQGFDGLPPRDTAPSDPASLRKVLLEVADRMRDNYPYFHPQYAGQMLKPPHAVARLAYALAMWINPNNHALDGGRASSAMEKEAVADIARMFGWETHLGHLTSGGTMANLEALWIAGQPNPGAAVLASSQAHYTHSRISAVLKLPFESVPVDDHGRMNLEALEARLKDGGVGTVVATLGTTAVGSVDPLPEILKLRDRYGFRLHADCAYGGYYVLADNLAPAARAAYDRLDRGRFDRHRPAQARPATLWLRLRAVSRPLGRRPLPARLAVHLFQFEGAAPRRDQPRVLAARRRGGRALGDAAPAAARARRRVRADAARLPRGGTGVPRRAGFGRALHRRLPARARHRRLGGARGELPRSPPPRPAQSSRAPSRRACISRSPNCRRNSSATPGVRAAR